MVLIIGHRGARSLWPENSLEGFERTRDLGVDAVEFDVHLACDDAPKSRLSAPAFRLT